MNKVDHKMAVFAALSEAHEPMSTAALLEVLGDTVSRRSLSRWLQEMVAVGAIRKIGSKKAVRYAVTNLPSANAMILPLFTPASDAALAYIAQPIYSRSPTPYNREWVKDYQPNVDYYLTETQRATLMAEGRRTDFGGLAGTYARVVYNRLLIDLSYNSSRLEGNTYSLLDTEKLVIEGIENESKLTEEKIMILNHKEAIRYLVDSASKVALTPEFICTLQFLLSDGLLLQEHCGVLRDHPVKIGGSTYLPLEQKKSLEEYLELICQKANAIQDPFEQSFFLLLNIAYLQCFEDCNKRTARLSANISLIKENLVPFSFNDIPKNDYINAMIAIYELNDVRPLADLYCFSYARTCQSYDATVQVMGFHKLCVIYREHRRALIRHIIMNCLHGDEMQAYIDEQIKQLIPISDQVEFHNIMQEDLRLLSMPRVAGMGIAAADFNAWKQGS